MWIDVYMTVCKYFDTEIWLFGYLLLLPFKNITILKNQIKSWSWERYSYSGTNSARRIILKRKKV